MSSEVASLLNQGYEARREERLEDARKAYAEAVQLCRLASDQAILAQALKRLGGIERDLHNIESALDHYREAATIQRTLDDGPALAHTVRHIGDILRESGQLGAAPPFYEEALSIYRSHPEADTLDLANTLRGFALLKSALGEPEAAIALWQEAGALYGQAWQEPDSPWTEADMAPGVAESRRQIALLISR
jgi:tetratricopeptide (TPR) repeat protein